MKTLHPFKNPSACLLAGFALFTGCADLSVLEPRADNDRFYFIEESPASLPEGREPSVLVGPSSVAKYLDQPKLVTMPEENVLEYSDNHRWAEPLEENINRYLQGGLSNGLETATVGFLRRMDTLKWDYRVGYHIYHLGGQPAGEVKLQVTWWVIAQEGERITFERSLYSTRAAGSGFPGYISAIKELLGEWTADIVGVIRTLEEQAATDAG